MIGYLLAITGYLKVYIYIGRKRDSSAYTPGIIFKDPDLNKTEDTFHQYVSTILVESTRMITISQLTS